MYIRSLVLTYIHVGAIAKSDCNGATTAPLALVYFTAAHIQCLASKIACTPMVRDFLALVELYIFWRSWFVLRAFLRNSTAEQTRDTQLKLRRQAYSEQVKQLLPSVSTLLGAGREVANMVGTVVGRVSAKFRTACKDCCMPVGLPRPSISLVLI